MKIFDLTNLYPYVPYRKLWIDAAIQATASHINTGINWLMNKETNKANERINQQQIEYAREAFEKEKEYNNWLLGNQRQMQMNDSKAAGVNPAFAQGSSLGGASISPKQDVPNMIPMDYNFDASGISSGIKDALSFMLQKKQVLADVRKTTADAEAQELLNEDKKAKNNALNDSYTITQVDPKTKKVIPDDKVDEWSLQHPDELPELVSIKDTRFNVGAEGRFEGEKMKREWKSRINSLDAQDWKNALEMSVHRLQMNDKGVMEALSQMPRKQFDELCEIVTSLANENSVWDKKKELLQIDLDMAKLQKRISENSNLYEYIEKMFDGDFTWKDFGKMVAMTLVGLVQNLGGIGVGVTNLRSLGSSKPNKIGFR